MEKDIINISGSIGLTILINNKTNKKVYIFYDDHSNSEYCKENNFYINNLFEYFFIKNQNTIFLLEEPFIKDGDKLIDLWVGSEHVVKFRKFYCKLLDKCKNKVFCKAFPIDIRLCMVEISLDELFDNLTTPNYFDDVSLTVQQYFSNILYLFDLNYSSESTKYKPDDNVIFIKRVFDIFNNSEYYLKLKEKVKSFYNKYIESNLNLGIRDFIIKYQEIKFEYIKGYPFIDNFSYTMTDDYDKIMSGIMEFYIVMLINYIDNDIFILNAGYFHCNNVEHILINKYGFEIIYQIGIVDDILNKKTSNIVNCLSISKKYL